MVAYIQCAAIGFCAGIRGVDSRFNFVSVEARCFAPEEGWTRHPQVGNCGASRQRSKFTQVNFSRVNTFGHARDERGVER
jgi:hypothetical protein